MSVIEPRVINGHHFERSTKSTDHLPILKARATWGGAERKLLNEAQLFAHSSGEVLFYGRIFGDSVKEDFIWTTQVGHTPRVRPGAEFRHSHSICPIGSGETRPLTDPGSIASIGYLISHPTGKRKDEWTRRDRRRRRVGKNPSLAGTKR
jgi:hypothetical protein